MQTVTIRMDRVFDVQPKNFSKNTRETWFSFESDGEKYFSISVKGNPELISGQTITAVLDRENDWQKVLGIRIHETGKIHAPHVDLNLWILLLITFFAGVLYMDLQYSRPDAVLPAFFGYLLIATFFVHNAVFAKRIRRALTADAQ